MPHCFNPPPACAKTNSMQIQSRTTFALPSQPGTYDRRDLEGWPRLTSSDRCTFLCVVKNMKLAHTTLAHTRGEMSRRQAKWDLPPPPMPVEGDPGKFKQPKVGPQLHIVFAAKKGGPRFDSRERRQVQANMRGSNGLGRGPPRWGREGGE